MPSSSRLSTDKPKNWGVWLRATDPRRRGFGGRGTSRGEANRSQFRSSGGESGGDEDENSNGGTSRPISPMISGQLRFHSPNRGVRGDKGYCGGVGQVACDTGDVGQHRGTAPVAVNSVGMGHGIDDPGDVGYSEHGGNEEVVFHDDVGNHGSVGHVEVNTDDEERISGDGIGVVGTGRLIG